MSANLEIGKFGKCMCVPDFGSYPQVDKTRGHVVWCDRLWGLNISAICHIGKHNDNCRQRGNANADNQLSSVWRVNTPTNMGSSSNLSSPRRLARTRIAPNAPGNALGFIKCFGPDLEHGHPKNIVSTYPPFYNTYPYYVYVHSHANLYLSRSDFLCNYCKEHEQSMIL